MIMIHGFMDMRIIIFEVLLDPYGSNVSKNRKASSSSRTARRSFIHSYGFSRGMQHTVLSDPESYMAWQDRYNKDHKQPVQKASRMLLTVGEMRVACGKLREYELGRSPPNSKDSKTINIYV